MNAQLEVAPYVKLEATTSASTGGQPAVTRRVGMRGAAKLDARFLGHGIVGYDKQLFDISREL